MSKLFFILSILVLLSGCEELVNIDTPSQKYPTQVGREWEYSTTWKIEYYNTIGHIDSNSTEIIENTIVQIIKEADTIGSHKDLVLFQSFDLSTPQSINKMWYTNADSGLFAIAYSNPGASQPVFPKQSIMTFEKFKHLIKTIGTYPGYFDPAKTLNQVTDTIQYYSPARKALMYPLTIGSRWIELTTPFFRERFIQKQQIINANGRNYNCYKIESNMSWPNFEFNDYMDMNSGLIVREIIADSMMIVTVTNPDSGAFVKSTTISRLVREKK
jgi:hypothetical protein